MDNRDTQCIFTDVEGHATCLAGLQYCTAARLCHYATCLARLQYCTAARLCHYVNHLLYRLCQNTIINSDLWVKVVVSSQLKVNYFQEKVSIAWFPYIDIQLFLVCMPHTDNRAMLIFAYKTHLGILFSIYKAYS